MGRYLDLQSQHCHEMPDGVHVQNAKIEHARHSYLHFSVVCEMQIGVVTFPLSKMSYFIKELDSCRRQHGVKCVNSSTTARNLLELQS